MSSLLSALVGSCLVALTAAQCATSNNANCGSWVTNGFCNNGAYTTLQKQAYCPNSCPVGCPGSPTTTVIPTSDQNTRCATWAANPTNPFCVNTMTAAQKRFYCASTCAFEITPNADCALYTVTGTAFARGTPSNRTATPGTAVASGAVAGTTTLSRVFANTGCTVKLFADAAPADTSVAGAEEHVGTAATKFFVVGTANNAALSYTCTCV